MCWVHRQDFCQQCGVRFFLEFGNIFLGVIVMKVRGWTRFFLNVSNCLLNKAPSCVPFPQLSTAAVGRLADHFVRLGFRPFVLSDDVWPCFKHIRNSGNVCAPECAAKSSGFSLLSVRPNGNIVGRLIKLVRIDVAIHVNT